MSRESPLPLLPSSPFPQHTLVPHPFATPLPPILFPLNSLRALKLSCPFFRPSFSLFSICCGLFYKNTRGGVSPLPPPKGQNPPDRSPAVANRRHPPPPPKISPRPSP